MKKTSLALLAISALMIAGCSSKIVLDNNLPKDSSSQAQGEVTDPGKMIPPDQTVQAMIDQVSSNGSTPIQQMPADELSALVKAQESGDIKKCDALKSDGDQKTCRDNVTVRSKYFKSE